MGDGPFALLTVIVIAGGLGLSLYIQFVWLDRHRPASDVTRLKAAMEDAARRVIRVEPDGVVPGAGRNAPTWRKYRVSIRELNGEITEHSVGVEATLFGYPAFCDFSHPHRAHRI